MRARAFALLLVGLWPLGGILSQPARAQSVSPQPSDQGVQLQPIGKIQSASGSFTVTHGDGVVFQAKAGPDGAVGRAKIGDSVFLHDTIETGPDGSVGLALKDGTAFDISPSARIVLDELVYDPNSRSNASLVSLTEGTFTFIAGKVAKTGNMRVQTPVATMGIRGTAPRVQISQDGSVRFSTLVEEYLRSGPNWHGVPGQPGKRVGPAPRERRVQPADQRQRHASNDLRDAALEQAIKDQNSTLEKKLGICRGC